MTKKPALLICLGVFSENDNAPRYWVLDADANFLATVERLRQVCIEHGLAQCIGRAREHRVMEGFPPKGAEEPYCPPTSLSVTSDGFTFIAPEYPAESVFCSFEELQALRAQTPLFPETPVVFHGEDTVDMTEAREDYASLCAEDAQTDGPRP